MKANEAPEKIYIAIDPIWGSMSVNYNRNDTNNIEYIREDAFIEKACEFWKDHLEGYDIFSSDIERSIESFKLAMKL